MVHKEKVVLDKFTKGSIRRKSKQLAGQVSPARTGKTWNRSCSCASCRACICSTPHQAHRNVLVTTVVERALAMILRERRAKKCDGGTVQSLDRVHQKAGDSAEPVDPRLSHDEPMYALSAISFVRHEPVDPRLSHDEPIDLATELAEVLARLPDDLRALAERLKSQSLAQAAHDRGMPRPTLQCQVQHLRRGFENAGLRIYRWSMRQFPRESQRSSK